MQRHRFRIVGGTDVDMGLRDHQPSLPTPDDVRKEARRRLSAAKIEPLRVRALATGHDMPATARYLSMQIEYVARSLSALHPIPADFADDIYWPA